MDLLGLCCSCGTVILVLIFWRHWCVTCGICGWHLLSDFYESGGPYLVLHVCNVSGRSHPAGLSAYPHFRDEETEVAQRLISPRMPPWGVEKKFKAVCLFPNPTLSPLFTQPYRQACLHRFDRAVRSNFPYDWMSSTKNLKSCRAMQKSIFWYSYYLYVLCSELEWHFLELSIQKWEFSL